MYYKHSSEGIGMVISIQVDILYSVLCDVDSW
jgi:hypothetical protein